METPEFCGCRHVNIAVEEQQHKTGQEGAMNSSVEQLVSRGSDTFTPPEQEPVDRKVGLDEAVRAIASNRIPENGVNKLSRDYQTSHECFSMSAGRCPSCSC